MRKVVVAAIFASTMIFGAMDTASAHNECERPGNGKSKGVTLYAHNHGQAAKQPLGLCLPEKVSENSAHGDIH